jgi:hypothetical protein
MEIAMSDPSKRKVSSSRFRSAALLAATMVTMIMASADIVSAAGTQSEVSREPVQFSGDSLCGGASPFCVVPITTTPPSKRKRLEVSGLSCMIRLKSGTIVDPQIFVDPGGVRYDFLSFQSGGIQDGERVFIARSATRYFVPGQSELKFLVTGTGDITKSFCTLVGEIVTYANR